MTGNENPRFLEGTRFIAVWWANNWCTKIFYVWDEIKFCDRIIYAFIF